MRGGEGKGGGVVSALGMEDDAVDVVVTLLEVGEHTFGAVNTIVQTVYLFSILGDFTFQRPLFRRVKYVESDDKKQHAQDESEEDCEGHFSHAILHSNDDLFVGESVGIEPVCVLLFQLIDF